MYSIKYMSNTGCRHLFPSISTQLFSILKMLWLLVDCILFFLEIRRKKARFLYFYTNLSSIVYFPQNRVSLNFFLKSFSSETRRNTFWPVNTFGKMSVNIHSYFIFFKQGIYMYKSQDILVYCKWESENAFWYFVFSANMEFICIQGKQFVFKIIWDIALNWNRKYSKKCLRHYTK